MGGSTSSREALSAATEFATERLLRDEAWGFAAPEVLRRLGAAAGAHRTYLFRNTRDPSGRLWMDLTGEWEAPGTRRIFETPTNHLHPYAPDFSRWIEVLGRGKTVHGPISTLPQLERRVLEAEEVVSTLVTPIIVRNEWWGFIGIDDCHKPRVWSDDEIEAMRRAAAAFGVSIGRGHDEQIRRMSEERFRAMVEQGPAVAYIDAADDAATTLYISPQVESMLGYSVDEWLSDAELWMKILHPDDKARATAENARHNATGAPFKAEYRMFAKDGRVVWVHDEAVMAPGEQGQPSFSHGVLMDVTERKKGEEQVAFHAYHDDLTGLPSRAMFQEFAELAVERAARNERSVAVLYLDIDDFRLANDSLGRQNGDRLLQTVADRLRETARETEVVARRGGDQFLVLIGDLERDGTGEIDAAVVRAEAVMQRMMSSLAAPFNVDGTELYLSASAGVSLFPQDADDAGTLQRNAETAMYESKKSGPGGFMVSSRSTKDSAARLQFVTRLRKAAESQRWTLFYQPVVDLQNGQMQGVEALLRWVEPDGTLISPSEFVPLAEELGLIESIGDWVVREIVFQAITWRDLGIDLEVGFNLSPKQFWQPDLTSRILGHITEAGLDPSRVMIEITEGSAMIDPDRAKEVLWDLHRGGLRLAIDDFGTGYSSLSRLREVPLNVLKIDRSFVAGVDGDPQAASIVSAFIELTKGLGMVTLAEGIETQGELEFLREIGCQLGQGFLFSPPVPPEEIIALSLGGAPMSAGLGSPVLPPPPPSEGVPNRRRDRKRVDARPRP
jgi:diguanylate cyclase (GGDEF)-like protein/PAS domain S-box-containing protein